MQEIMDENFDRSRIINLFAFFIENLLLYCQFIVRKSNRMLRNFCENLKVAEIVDAISDKLGEHPILRFIALATALSCAVPVVMFIAFGLVSVVVTFAGFLLIEGTLLAVGSLCMFVCLVTMTLVMSVMAVILGMLYVIALKLGTVLNNYETTSNMLRRILPAVPARNDFETTQSLVNAHQD